MKVKFLTSIGIATLCILYANYGYGQTGVTIGTQNPPDPSAILDLQTSQHGILIPRLTTTERNAIANPAEGLQIYNLTTQCLELYFPGQGWSQIKCSCTQAPAQPGAITGSITFCNNQQGATYSISAVPGAISYQWTVPPGASVASGQGTTGITVNYGTQGGNISVVAINSCGTSTPQNLAVAPGSVTAAFTTNPGSPGINVPVGFIPAFSVNGTQYQWTFPNGNPATSNLQNPSVTWSLAGTYAVILSVTDPAGCVDIDTQSVVVANCVTGSSFAFSTCGATGRIGPNQTQANNTYGNGQVTISGNGIQRWIVPANVCNITITAKGAQGGAVSSNLGGQGATITGTFAVSGGTVLNIVVGQKGLDQSNNNCNGGGGGGGSFVYLDNAPNPLIAAGGGGGGHAYLGPGIAGTTTIQAATSGNSAGTPGNNGNGGGAGPCGSGWPGAAGAGWLADGADCCVWSGGTTEGGYTKPDWRGGTRNLSTSQGSQGQDGSFGGGGAAFHGAGGGGGYSGGGGGGSCSQGEFPLGGGGGSYNGGTSPSNTAGNNPGHGSVVISW